MKRIGTEKSLAEIGKDEHQDYYQILFERSLDLTGTDDRAMCLAPLSYWLCDTIDPERILTVGTGCELLHITMCEKTMNHVMRAECIHMAEQFSHSFLEARKAYGSALSQIIVPDPNANLMGSTGQFDLIFVSSSEPLSRAHIDSWKTALTINGLLVICSESDSDMTPDDDLINLQIGHQRLLLASSPSPGGGIPTIEQIRAVLQAHHSSLVNALTASVADLTIRSKNAHREQNDRQIADLTQRHAADLISVTKKLAKIEEENIELRVQLKSVLAELEALQPEITDTEKA